MVLCEKCDILLTKKSKIIKALQCETEDGKMKAVFFISVCSNCNHEYEFSYSFYTGLSWRKRTMAGIA